MYVFWPYLAYVVAIFLMLLWIIIQLNHFALVNTWLEKFIVSTALRWNGAGLSGIGIKYVNSQYICLYCNLSSHK